MNIIPFSRPLWLLACLAAASPVAAESVAVIMATPDQFVWQAPASLPPGAKLAVIEGRMDQPGPITARIMLPAGYHIPPHWHPGVERVTVLSGTFHYGMGDSADKTSVRPMPAGSVIVMPAEMRHYVWTREPTVVQLNVTGPWGIVYVNPADDPRQK